MLNTAHIPEGANPQILGNLSLQKGSGTPTVVTLCGARGHVPDGRRQQPSLVRLIEENDTENDQGGSWQLSAAVLGPRGGEYLNVQ